MGDNNNTNVEELNDAKAEKILWASISRNKTILVEAGDDPFEGAVSQTAHGILGQKATPGWEFFTLKNGDGWFGGGKNRKADSFGAPRVPRLKGVKFHIHEHASKEEEE